MRKSHPIIRPNTRNGQKGFSPGPINNFPQKRSTLGDQEIVLLRENLFQNPNLSEIPADRLIKLRHHLQVFTQNCLTLKQYIRAKQSIDLETLVAQELEDQCQIMKNILDKPQRLQTSLKPKKVHPALKAFDEETIQKEEAILIRQAKMLDQFEEIWSTKLHDQYYKESTRVVCLKELLVEAEQDEDFPMADRIKSDIEQLQEIEAKEASALYDQNYDVAHTRLITRFENELKAFKHGRKQEREMMSLKAEKLGPCLHHTAPTPLKLTLPPVNETPKKTVQKPKLNPQVKPPTPEPEPEPEKVPENIAAKEEEEEEDTRAFITSIVPLVDNRTQPSILIQSQEKLVEEFEEEEEVMENAQQPKVEEEDDDDEQKVPVDPTEFEEEKPLPELNESDFEASDSRDASNEEMASSEPVPSSSEDIRSMYIDPSSATGSVLSMNPELDHAGSLQAFTQVTANALLMEVNPEKIIGEAEVQQDPLPKDEPEFEEEQIQPQPEAEESKFDEETPPLPPQTNAEESQFQDEPGETEFEEEEFNEKEVLPPQNEPEEPKFEGDDQAQVESGEVEFEVEETTPPVEENQMLVDEGPNSLTEPEQEPLILNNQLQQNEETLLPPPETEEQFAPQIEENPDQNEPTPTEEENQWEDSEEPQSLLNETDQVHVQEQHSDEQSPKEEPTAFSPQQEEDDEIIQSPPNNFQNNADQEEQIVPNENLIPVPNENDDQWEHLPNNEDPHQQIPSTENQQEIDSPSQPAVEPGAMEKQSQSFINQLMANPRLMEVTVVSDSNDFMDFEEEEEEKSPLEQIAQEVLDQSQPDEPSHAEQEQTLIASMAQALTNAEEEIQETKEPHHIDDNDALEFEEEVGEPAGLANSIADAFTTPTSEDLPQVQLLNQTAPNLDDDDWE